MSSYSSHPPGVLLCLWALPGLAQAPHHPRRGSVHLLPNKPTSVHSTRLSVRTRSPPGFSSVLRFLHSQKLLPVVSLSSTPLPGAVYTTDAQLRVPVSDTRRHLRCPQVISEPKLHRAGQGAGSGEEKEHRFRGVSARRKPVSQGTLQRLGAFLIGMIGAGSATGI